jgi:transposase
VIAKRTRAKNSLRTLLRCAGVVPPSRPALWTKQGLEWLRRLELPTASHRLRRDLLLEEVATLSRQAERIEIHLNQQAKLSPAVLLLRSIPGVGVRTAEAVTAFIDDPDRFRDAKAIGRYFGLVSSQDQSGNRNRLGHITREGPAVVRQLVAEATWQALRRSPRRPDSPSVNLGIVNAASGRFCRNAERVDPRSADAAVEVRSAALGTVLELSHPGIPPAGLGVFALSGCDG